MADTNQWGESGILRGKKPEEDDLLVFGYSCKLFRDDEKALFIDQGKHLIPWMGDESLKIDRYDGRAALADLRHLEAGRDHYDFLAGLSEGERRVEALCDEERYRALHHQEDDEELYHEEELKRLQLALAGQNKQYAAVQYAYDAEAQRTVQVDEQSREEEDEDDTPFVPPPELDIPVNMVLPSSQKLHSIVERTSVFIAKQGGQMEVLIKAKQANNPQFGFLSYDNALHPYYKLLLAAVRSGRYRPREPANEEEAGDEEEEDEEEDHYLHPSLAVSTKVDSAPAIPSIAYKPSADCAYSMLVTKIRGKQPPAPTPPPIPQPQSFAPVLPPPVFEPSVPPPAPVVVTPPSDMCVVVEKMAAYVAKNGLDFESVVRSKGQNDPRFSFLEPGHVYHGFYRKRLFELLALNQSLPASAETRKEPPTPVSFSIKQQSGEGVLETRSALDEQGERPRAGEAYMATALQSVADVPLPPGPPSLPEQPLSREEMERRQAATQRSKIAEERLRAKLLAAARERVASHSKEKQVQQERKRKVAAFLSKLALEKRQIVVTKPPPIIGPQLPPELQPPPEEQDEVRSLPSPSPPGSPTPPPAPSMSITPPPPPTIGSLDSPVLPRRLSSPRPNGDRKRRRSRSPSSRRHKSHRNSASRRSSASSRPQHRHRSDGRRKSRPSPSTHRKRSSRDSSSPPRKSRSAKRRGRSSSSSSSSSSGSSSSSSSSPLEAARSSRASS